MLTFTVIGLWTDTDQRFSDYVRAKNAAKAEAICHTRHNGLTICGVIQGRHKCLDHEPDAPFPPP